MALLPQLDQASKEFLELADRHEKAIREKQFCLNLSTSQLKIVTKRLDEEKKELERLREKKLEIYQKISEDNERIDAQTKKLLEIQTANKFAASDLARAEAKYKADSERVNDFCKVLENNMTAAKVRDSAQTESLKMWERSLFEETRKEEKSRLEEAVSEHTRILELNKRNKNNEKIIVKRTSLLEKAILALKKLENAKTSEKNSNQEEFDQEQKKLTNEKREIHHWIQEQPKENLRTYRWYQTSQLCDSCLIKIADTIQKR